LAVFNRTTPILKIRRRGGGGWVDKNRASTKKIS